MDVLPNVAKAGAIQSPDAKGAAVVFYRNPLATTDLDLLRLSRKGNKMRKFFFQEFTNDEFLNAWWWL